MQPGHVEPSLQHAVLRIFVERFFVLGQRVGDAHHRAEVDVEHGRPHALCGEREDRGSSDAGCAPGDDGDLIFE